MYQYVSTLSVKKNIYDEISDIFYIHTLHIYAES